MIWERLDHLSSELIAEAERKFAIPSLPVVSVDLDSISCPMVQGVPLWFCHLQWWRRLWDVWFCPDWGVVRIRCGWTWGGDFIVFTRLVFCTQFVVQGARERRPCQRRRFHLTVASGIDLSLEFPLEWTRWNFILTLRLGECGLVFWIHHSQSWLLLGGKGCVCLVWLLHHSAELPLCP